MSLLQSRRATKVLGKPKEIGLPPKARWGEQVPKTGTHCSNCEYLKDAKQMICGNADFVAWNGSNKIPAPNPDVYCSIWWAENKEKSK